ncbi:MAG: GNAT family N-acetyltransferase [Clostridiaceae bacterium]|nr:GNAT family N-acetyltransferase [Clostridiaceae bacterium]
MVRKANINDLENIAELAVLMWSNHSIQELTEEFSEIITKDSAQFFLKYQQDEPIGFAQCQLRYDYVEGTYGSPVGYLEGIFIKEHYRHNGYAKELLTACEEWAKAKGCTEFASDCEVGNDDSFHFHKAMGFTDVNRIICFTKKLT